MQSISSAKLCEILGYNQSVANVEINNIVTDSSKVQKQVNEPNKMLHLHLNL